jgi:hypothetical protein
MQDQKDQDANVHGSDQQSNGDTTHAESRRDQGSRPSQSAQGCMHGYLIENMHRVSTRVSHAAYMGPKDYPTQRQ